MKTIQDIKDRLESIINKDNTQPYDSDSSIKKQVLTELLSQFDSIPKRYKKYSFENLEVTPSNKEAIEAVKAMDIEAGDFILMHGTSGNGKTHLAVAGMVYHVIKGGRNPQNPLLTKYNCAYVELSEYFRQQRARMNGEKIHIPDYAKYDILIIDDLGKLKPSDWNYQELFNLIERRWSNEKATIITTNFSMDELPTRISNIDAPDMALMSRLTSGKVFEIKGKDRRQI